MNRRAILMALASIPILGKLVDAAPRYTRPWIPEGGSYPHYERDAAGKLHQRRISDPLEIERLFKDKQAAERANVRKYGWHAGTVLKDKGRPIWGYEGSCLPDAPWSGGRWAVLDWRRNTAYCHEMSPLDRTRLKFTDVSHGQKTPREAYAWVMADPRN